MCPNCQEPLLILELEGIEIDYCENCSGVWLDSGELDLIFQIEAPELVDDDLVEKSSQSSSSPNLADMIVDAPSKSKTSKRCVRCNAKMEIIYVTEKIIELDRCPLGDGIWLDKGELVELIHQEHEQATGIVAQFFHRMYANQLNETETE